MRQSVVVSLLAASSAWAAPVKPRAAKPYEVEYGLSFSPSCRIDDIYCMKRRMAFIVEQGTASLPACEGGDIECLKSRGVSAGVDLEGPTIILPRVFINGESNPEQQECSAGGEFCAEKRMIPSYGNEMNVNADAVDGDAKAGAGLDVPIRRFNDLDLDAGAVAGDAKAGLGLEVPVRRRKTGFTGEPLDKDMERALDPIAAAGIHYENI